ncbi:dTMP kinase [Candidatus Phytoplasma melaleucae]|uniref:Thymidylate kinase n=1 Tax=Candidatus Phytoplasma melaleucae TaxID=2982630 RepID=A0ABT9DER7_9MOLU|nr:dTMP kinase ['Melaleuca sp.' phytoplasma]MDO8168096.1 dTMP kinase ['Melaleuca sp.' phytoplasma]MDV3205276.1 dTMP kinase [Weeping tea tree witches'-broom phytoplasma]
MFISFEGGEGVGKTTLAIYLFKKIVNKYPVILTKEPGGCKFNIPIKKILMQFYNKVDFITEALLYAADRTEHLTKVIIPVLQQNKIVICDRFLDSSFVYQGYVRKLGINFIQKINPLACEWLPDVTFYLDVDPSIALQRLKSQRKQKIEYFDLQKKHFHDQVRQGYLQLCLQYPQRICKINANRSLKEIQLSIAIKIKELFQIDL